MGGGARRGTPIPDGATAQYLYIRDHGATMIGRSRRCTRRARCCSTSATNRGTSATFPPTVTLRSALGDGVHTIEARGRKYGTNVFDSDGRPRRLLQLRRA